VAALLAPRVAGAVHPLHVGEIDPRAKRPLCSSKWATISSSYVFPQLQKSCTLNVLFFQNCQTPESMRCRFQGKEPSVSGNIIEMDICEIREIPTGMKPKATIP
jgi:hypothetical protein